MRAGWGLGVGFPLRRQASRKARKASHGCFCLAKRPPKEAQAYAVQGRAHTGKRG
jgi:hypothetical protein